MDSLRSFIKFLCLFQKCMHDRFRAVHYAPPNRFCCIQALCEFIWLSAFSIAVKCFQYRSSTRVRRSCQRLISSFICFIFLDKVLLSTELDELPAFSLRFFTML